MLRGSKGEISGGTVALDHHGCPCWSSVRSMALPKGPSGPVEIEDSIHRRGIGDAAGDLNVQEVWR